MIPWLLLRIAMWPSWWVQCHVAKAWNAKTFSKQTLASSKFKARLLTWLPTRMWKYWLSVILLIQMPLLFPITLHRFQSETFLLSLAWMIIALEAYWPADWVSPFLLSKRRQFGEIIQPRKFLMFRTLRSPFLMEKCFKATNWLNNSTRNTTVIHLSRYITIPQNTFIHFQDDSNSRGSCYCREKAF